MNTIKLIEFLRHPDNYPDCDAKRKVEQEIEIILGVSFVLLEQEIYGIRRRCSCYLEKREKIFEKNPNFRSGALGSEGLKDIFKGTRCNVCKTYTPRKKDSKFKTCLNCGDNMEDLNKKVEQAGILKQIFQCPYCKLQELQEIIPEDNEGVEYTVVKVDSFLDPKPIQNVNSQRTKKSLIKRILKDLFLPFEDEDVERVIELLPAEKRSEINSYDRQIRGIDDDVLDEVSLRLKIADGTFEKTAKTLKDKLNF